MAVRFNPPETFNFGNPTEWTDWKQRFLRFRLATKLQKEDPEVQISTLIYVMGKEAEHVFRSFVFAENDDSKKFDPVLQKFDEYFVPKRNVIHERAKFHRCSQNPGENVESFRIIRKTTADRKLTSAEQKYAQIEKECLAALWACEKFSRYLVGLHSFRLFTDHKPLVPLIKTQDLDRAPLRCQRMLMRLRGYNLIAEHIPGKLLIVPDTLSRSPISDVTSEKESILIEEIEVYTVAVDSLRPIADRRLEQIRCATNKDPILQEALNYTRFGWPVYVNSVRDDLRDLFASRNELTISQGLLLYRDRIVIPESMRNEMLEIIHEGHQGLNKCRARAQASVWWPRISSDIKNRIESCDFCQKHRPSQPREPLKVSNLPERPWQRIAADICELEGRQYLVVTDYYSRFLEIAHLGCLTSAEVIGRLKNMFARWGIPEELVTDNGRQFTSTEFCTFADKFRFRQMFSSPYYPQSNGEAESAVKVAKRILRQDDIFTALMSYRATPIEATGKSPAEMMMGRKLRTQLPTLPESLDRSWSESDHVRLHDAMYKDRMKLCYDRRHNTKPLPEICNGDTVRLKTDKEDSWTLAGKIKETNYGTRSYVVETPRGEYRRNRRHLQPTPAVPVEPPVPEIKPSIIQLSDDSEPSVKPTVPDDSVLRSNTTRSGRHVNLPKKFQDFEMT